MDQGQTRVATGLKINSAKDNPSLWAASEGLRSNIRTASRQQDGVTLAQIRADKTGTAVGSIREVLGEMKTLVEIAANATASQKVLLQKDMEAYQAQLRSLVASAELNGANPLAGTSLGTVEIGSDGSGAPVTMALDDSGLGMITGARTGTFAAAGETWNKAADAKGSLLEFDLTFEFNGPGPSTTSASLAAMMTDLDTTIASVDGVVSRVASYAKRLETQSDFMTRIVDIQQAALSSMVDADLNEESAKLAALQVRMQLAVNVLQLSNSRGANILRLFE